jgi:hypothetical protein
MSVYYTVFKNILTVLFDTFTTQALVSFKKYMPSPLPYFKVNIYPSPLRLNIFRLFVILSLTQLYRLPRSKEEEGGIYFLNETSACDLPMMSHFIFISNLTFI